MLMESQSNFMHILHLDNNFKLILEKIVLLQTFVTGKNRNTDHVDISNKTNYFK